MEPQTTSKGNYDDSRIQDFPDKLLLSRLRNYFELFTSGDYNGMRNLESEDYTMTDIRKLIPSSPFLYLGISLIRYLS